VLSNLSNAKMAIFFWDDALKKQKLLQHEKLSSPFKQHNIPVKKLHLISKRLTPHSTRKNGGHQFSNLSLML
jgi:hypothetical protein